jgi:hypothetical protein
MSEQIVQGELNNSVCCYEGYAWNEDNWDYDKDNREK